MGTKVEDIGADHAEEKRRLRKVLDLSTKLVKGLDPELFPDVLLTQINNHLRQPNFWNQLHSYSSNQNVQNLRTANDHFTALIPTLFQLSGFAKKPETQKLISASEKAYDQFCKAIEEKKSEFANSIDGHAAEISVLQTQETEISTSLDTLTTTTDSQISTWQTEFTDGQTTRAEEHSAAQIERSEEYEVALREFKTSADTNQKT